MQPIEKLTDLIKNNFGNSQAAFARAIKRSPSQVNQWLSGYRRLDVKASRHIEKELGLPIDYFSSTGNDTPASPLQKNDEKYETPDSTELYCSENKKIATFLKQSASPLVQEIAKLAETMSRDGQLILLGRVQELAKLYPAEVKTATSSQ